MRWLILLLFVPLVYGSCYKVNNNIFCEAEIGINIIENNTPPEFEQFESEVYMSKQRFLGNFVFILIAIGALIFAFASLLKT